MDTMVWTPSGTNRSGVYEMLVLSRKIGEKILIGDHIVLTVVKIDRNQIRLGIEAPTDVKVYREELVSTPDKPATDVATKQQSPSLAQPPLYRGVRHPGKNRPAGSK